MVNGLKSGIVKVKEVVGLLANTILSTLREILGIHSPARVPMEYGELTGEGFAVGIGNATMTTVEAVTKFVGKAITTLKDLTVSGVKYLITNMPKILEFFSKIPWGTIIFGGLAISLAKGVGKLDSTLDKISEIVSNNPLTILTKAANNLTIGINNLMTELGKAKK